MQKLTLEETQPSKQVLPLLQQQAIDFITIGVGCNCLVALEESGVLYHIFSTGSITEKEIQSYTNPLCITTALVTLIRCDVVQQTEQGFTLTSLGYTLVEYLGLVIIFFDGYAPLVAQQSQITRNQIKARGRYIRGPSVSRSSVLIAQALTESVILQACEIYYCRGTICDLGCGYADTLKKMCEQTGNPGLGFESEPKVVKQLLKRFKGTDIRIRGGDISRLQGCWPEVTALTQFHVMHDFIPEQVCIGIMKSYLETFPNLRYFFYMDSVAPTDANDSILPGFDYVHGLLGIQARTYEETIQMFQRSTFQIEKEIAFPHLPSTFLWILTPR